MATAVARPVFPASRFLRFLAVALLVAGSVHFYFWLRLVHDTALPEPWYALATALLVGLALSMPLSFLIRRRRPGVVWPAQIWMGVLLLLFTALLAADLLRGVLGIAGHSLGPRMMEG